MNPVEDHSGSNKKIEMSGLYYPNRFSRFYLETLEDVLGEKGVNAILNLAGLSDYIENYPPDNLEKGFDFAAFTALQVALEDIYGIRGGRGLAQRAGRETFSKALRHFGALAGVGDLAFKVLPLTAKLRIGTAAMAKIFTQFSDQVSNVKEHRHYFEYRMERCPMCWNRKTDHLACYGGLGILKEGMHWISGGKDIRVDMVTCMGRGDDMGRYYIYKDPLD